MLQGIRCYTNAATEPDTSSTLLRLAGLGVFILNLPHQIFLQALVDNISSVLMVEAAALTLAAKIILLLQLQGTSFLVDNQLLATFLYSSDHSTPPDWTIKAFTQQFINFTSASSSKVFKIARQNNTTAHALARQAKASLTSIPHNLSFTCSNPEHVSRCPLVDALSSVH